MTIAPELRGLVLVGGRSTRMGRDKAALAYGDKPQAVAAHELLQTVCPRVFLSCRPGQPASLPAIHDVVADLGPMGGILSALTAHPDAAWLVLACDLPFVTAATLRHLVAHRDPSRPATAFRGPRDGLPEPLCAIYEPTILETLRDRVARGRLSPRGALIDLAVPLLDPPDGRALDNVNDPHEFERAREALGKP